MVGAVREYSERSNIEEGMEGSGRVWISQHDRAARECEGVTRKNSASPDDVTRICKARDARGRSSAACTLQIHFE